MKTLLEELKSLSSNEFPKKCNSCGREYTNQEDYLRQTDEIAEGKNSFRESRIEDGTPVLELYRNCICGSTLVSLYMNRRDTSEQGQERRQVFSELMGLLAGQGVDSAKARQELLKVIHGERSELLEKMGLS